MRKKINKQSKRWKVLRKKIIKPFDKTYNLSNLRPLSNRYGTLRWFVTKASLHLLDG